METRTWALVTSTSPLRVQFCGCGTSVPIALKNTAIAPSLNDKVVVEVVGTQWVLAYILGST